MFKKTTDFAILATKKQICAIKDVLYRISYETVGIGNLPEGLPGGQVNLESVMAWSIWRYSLVWNSMFRQWTSLGSTNFPWGPGTDW